MQPATTCSLHSSAERLSINPSSSSFRSRANKGKIIDSHQEESESPDLILSNCAELILNSSNQKKILKHLDRAVTILSSKSIRIMNNKNDIKQQRAKLIEGIPNSKQREKHSSDCKQWRSWETKRQAIDKAISNRQRMERKICIDVYIQKIFIETLVGGSVRWWDVKGMTDTLAFKYWAKHLIAIEKKWSTLCLGAPPSAAPIQQEYSRLKRNGEGKHYLSACGMPLSTQGIFVNLSRKVLIKQLKFIIKKILKPAYLIQENIRILYVTYDRNHNSAKTCGIDAQEVKKQLKSDFLYLSQTFYLLNKKTLDTCEEIKTIINKLELDIRTYAADSLQDKKKEPAEKLKSTWEEILKQIQDTMSNVEKSLNSLKDDHFIEGITGSSKLDDFSARDLLFMRDTTRKILLGAKATEIKHQEIRDGDSLTFHKKNWIVKALNSSRFMQINNIYKKLIYMIAGINLREEILHKYAPKLRDEWIQHKLKCVRWILKMIDNNEPTSDPMLQNLLVLQDLELKESSTKSVYALADELIKQSRDEMAKHQAFEESMIDRQKQIECWLKDIEKYSNERNELLKEPEKKTNSPSSTQIVDASDTDIEESHLAPATHFSVPSEESRQQSEGSEADIIGDLITPDEVKELESYISDAKRET